MDAGEIQLAERPNQRLNRQKAHPRRRHAEDINTALHLGFFDRNTKPDVRRHDMGRPVLPLHVALHDLRALGEHLELMPMSPVHDGKNVINEVSRHIPVEQVRHAVDEDAPRALPAERLLKPPRPKGQVKARLKRVTRRAAPALGKPLSVAVIAPGADLRAAGDRVPSGIGPLDGALVTHGPNPCATS
jgi:hypothetical protein